MSSRAAGTTRSHLARRMAVVADDRTATIAALRAAADPDAVGAAVAARTATGATAGGVAFVFTGHGSHHAGAGRELYAAVPVFRAAVDRCAELLGDVLDVPLTDVMFGDGSLLGDMTYAQPALFALQYALAETWASWGVRPDAVAGHSAGEYVAAVVAGVLDLADGLRLIAARGRLLASVSGDGQMVALFTDEASVAAALAGRTADVGIAAVNGPFTTVVSGRPAAVAALIADLDLDADEVRPLDISVAAHSPLVEPVLDALADEVASVALARPSISLVSSMTGQFVDDELTDVGYWRRHLRQPVRFTDVFATLREAGYRTLVEIGPHPTLLGLGRRNWPDADAAWVASMRRDTRLSWRSWRPAWRRSTPPAVTSTGRRSPVKVLAGAASSCRTTRGSAPPTGRPWPGRVRWRPGRCSTPRRPPRQRRRRRAHSTSAPRPTRTAGRWPTGSPPRRSRVRSASSACSRARGSRTLRPTSSPAGCSVATTATSSSGGWATSSPTAG